MLTSIIALLSGPAFGSIMKIVGGFIDRRAAIQEAREKRKLAAEIGKGKIDDQFQQQVFGDSAGGAYARVTRRILGIIGMLTLCATDLLCVIWPSVPLLTLTAPISTGGTNFLWGLLSSTTTSGDLRVVTTGHLAVIITYILSTIVGFYFTPGGRK